MADDAKPFQSGALGLDGPLEDDALHPGPVLAGPTTRRWQPGDGNPAVTTRLWFRHCCCDEYVRLQSRHRNGFQRRSMRNSRDRLLR